MERILKSVIMDIAEKVVSKRVFPSTGQLAVIAVCAVLAAILMSGVLVCVSVALWLWIAPYLGAAQSWLIVAVLFLSLFLGVCAILYKRVRFCQRCLPRNDPSDLLTEALHLLQTHKVSVLAGALIAGLAAGRCKR